MIRLLSCAILFAAVAGAAHAAPAASAAYSKTHTACMAKATTTLDMVTCNTAELAARDAALNLAYGKAIKRAGDASALLKAAEKAWIAFRNADCSVYEDREQFGTLGEIEAGTCMIDRTIQRTRELDQVAPDMS